MASWMSGSASSSSSRIGSSADVQANPIDSSVSRSASSGIPVSWPTWRRVRVEGIAKRW